MKLLTQHYKAASVEQQLNQHKHKEPTTHSKAHLYHSAMCVKIKMPRPHPPQSIMVIAGLVYEVYILGLIIIGLAMDQRLRGLQT